MGQGGLILLVNKTPYAWNRTNQKSYNMNHWDNRFPEVLLPGVCEKVYVEWESSPDDHDDAGEIFYELAETGGLKFQIWARGRKRDKEGADSGLSVYFENLVTGQQPKRSWLNLGWQHDGYVGFVLTGNVHSFYSSAITSNAKWMSFIDGEKKLNSLTIPGTHDTGAYTDWFTEGARCQNRNISSQLDMGIRFLDIRLKLNSGKLRVYHASEPASIDFAGDVLQVCYGFLDRNPSETIIMSIKNEKGDPADEDFDKAVKDVIEQLEQAHYWHTKVRIPTLDEVRRKIVLFRRYALADSSAKLGIEAAPSHWKDNDQFSFTNDDGVLFDIQDTYSAFRRWNVREKFDKYVRDALNTARGNEGSNTLYVNFTSAGYSGGLYPRTIAYGYMLIREDFEGINVMFSNWLQDNKSNQRLGIIPMDCPEERNNGVLPSQLVYRNDFNRYETRLVNGCIYEIHAGQSLGSALNVRGNLSSPGTQVMLFHSTGGKNTQWKLDDGGNNSSVLRPQNAPELVLAVEGAKTADKTPAIISEYRNEPHQKWLVVGGPAGLPFFHITPGHSPGKALEVYGGNVADHTPATLWEYNGSPAQIWLFMMVGFASNRVYTLSPRCAARRCFVGRIVPGGVGTRLNYGIQPANGGTEQQWKLELVPNEDGWYYIVAVAPSGGVLDVEGAKTNDRATTIVHIKNGGDNQKWRIESCGNGYFVLRPKHAQNKVLELYEANTANGAEPSLYSANGSVAQQWILRPI